MIERNRTRARRTQIALRVALAAAGGLAALVLLAAPAAAGGGCWEGATQGSGTTVVLSDACPSPTILHVQPGAAVTFENRDPYAHNVIGVGLAWGHPDELAQGDAFQATFRQPGIYPYACWIHPGMTGAVVVGDGTGPGNGNEVTVGSTPTPEPVAPSSTPVAAEVDGRGSATLGWVAGGAIGLALGLGIGLAARRRGAGSGA